MTSDKSEGIETNNASPVEESFKEDQNTEENVEERESKWEDLLGSGSILKKITQEGTPDSRPERLQMCTVNYELSLEDGTIVESQDKFKFQLGDCEVIQGLDVAIGLMNVGERCLVKIQPRLGFGSLGLPPKIPPNATVIYDIELLEAEPEVDPETLSILERKQHGNKKRERGNWWYGRGENTLAIQCYRRALDFLDEVEGGMYQTVEKNKTSEEVSDSTLQDLLEDRISVCNNMAATQIKLELYDAALNSLQTVLRCQPNNVKALFRKAKVHKAKHDLNSALKCLKKASEVDPSNVDVQKEIATVTKLIQKQKVTERELAKRMFGDPKAQTNSKETQKKSSRNWLVLSAGAAASVAVGLAGLAAYRLKFT